MSDENYIEEIPEEFGAEQAFAEAKRGYVLFEGEKDAEIELKPYSPSRVLAAQNIGVRYPHIGNENWEVLTSTGSYPGQMEDTFKLLWLCTLPDRIEKPGGWTPDTAASRPAAARIAAIGWGTKLGLTDMQTEKGVKRFAEAAQIAMMILHGIEVSKFKTMRAESLAKAEEEDDSPKV